MAIAYSTTQQPCYRARAKLGHIHPLIKLKSLPRTEYLQWMSQHENHCVEMLSRYLASTTMHYAVLSNVLQSTNSNITELDILNMCTYVDPWCSQHQDNGV